MNLFRIIEEILHSKFKTAEEKGVFILKEESADGYPETELKKKGNALVYNFDKSNEDTLPFFAPKDFVKKCVDYVIFYPKNGYFYVFLCELKSNHHKAAYEQFFATKHLIDYIVEMAKSYSMYKNLSLNQNLNLRETNPRR